MNESKGNRISEIVFLLVSTLIGMNFMISSGDFLMFYLGLELATMPLAALAAYETYKDRSAEAGIKLILSSDLVISRCGASTTAELAYTITPFIAVPLPNSIQR